jgi:hypothetical protein
VVYIAFDGCDFAPFGVSYGSHVCRSCVLNQDDVRRDGLERCLSVVKHDWSYADETDTNYRVEERNL